MEEKHEASPGKSKLPDERKAEKERNSARVPGLTDSERDKTPESNTGTPVNEQPDAVPGQKPVNSPYTDESGNQTVRTDQGL